MTSYSPFDCLPIAEQTPAGLLLKLEDEVVVANRDNVGLRSAMAEPLVPIGNNGAPLAGAGQWVDRMDGLHLQITSHRLVFWHEGPPRRARYQHLSHLMQASAETAIFKSPKILLSTYSGDFLMVFKISNDRDAVLELIQRQLQRQEWEKKRDTRERTEALTRHKVGVDKILAKHRYQQKQAEQLTSAALLADDAESLLKEATELSKLIQRQVATLERQQESGADQSTEARQLVGMLADMGMASALNKTDFRCMDSYFRQLARQLADVLRPKLAHSGGVMTLTDAYCFFNRARASNLISPEDFRSAVDMLVNMDLAMEARTFPSGLVVLRDTSVKIVEVAEKLKSQAASGMNELEAARLLQTSAVLAAEQLLEAEQLGFLARDETLETLRFFPNRFEEWQSQ